MPAPVAVRLRSLTSRCWLLVVAAIVGTATLGTGRVRAADAAAASAKQVEAQRAKLVAQGIEYLRTKGQAADGSYSAQAGIGPTALIATALIRNSRPLSDPQVAKSLAYLEKHVQSDGGVYLPRSTFHNYETCLAVMCFSEANRSGRYRVALDRAKQFLRRGQVGNGDGVESADAAYGGVGYGGATRPDLSNTAFFIEALRAAGTPENDPAIQRALAFVSRCQNLETEHNNTPHAAKNPDGGFYYTPIGEGSSPAGKTPTGGLRSYGAMSYAGLKSMIYAGLTADDPRVKAALEWARQNYSVQSNPGLGSAGLYYYLHLFATAMQASGLAALEDKNGVRHDWRAELVTELAKQQRGDGSWTNSNSKWMEGDPNLVTGFALLTLSYCAPPEKAQPAGGKPAGKSRTAKSPR